MSLILNKYSQEFVPASELNRSHSNSPPTPPPCVYPTTPMTCYSQQSIKTPPCTLAGYSASSPSVISMGAYSPDSQFVGIPVTASQLCFMLKRELSQLRAGTEFIDKRQRDDRVTFMKCEKTLIRNIQNEKKVLDEKLDALSVDSADKQKMRDLLDQIVDLDTRINEAQQCSSEANTEYTRTVSIVKNKRLLRDISREISHWNSVNWQLEQETKRRNTARTKRGNIELSVHKSRAMSDALETNAELEAQISSLRKQVHRIYSQRHQSDAATFIV